MLVRTIVLTFALILAPFHLTSAAVIEVGNMNIIDDVGNASDGLRFLDMSYSQGLSLAAALAAAQLEFTNARLASASEFDDLFDAAGIAYDGVHTAADGFEPGGNVVISSGGHYDDGALSAALGYTFSFGTLIWTAPDDDNAITTSRDFIQLYTTEATIYQGLALPPAAPWGFLLVSEATLAADVPAPLTVHLLCLGLTGLALGRRREKSCQI